jgi:hypothetical protein
LGRIGLDRVDQIPGHSTAKGKAIMATGIGRIEARKVREDKARKALVCPKSI